MIKKLWFPILGLVVTGLLYSLVPPPPTARAQFVDQQTYGGTSGGTANAQTITIANYSAHSAGVVLRFVPGNINTGPATINVSSLGNVAIQRPSSIGNVALSGGELQTGELTCVTYNGTVYQLACNLDMTPIGKTVEYRGAATPRGTLIEDGSVVSRATYAALFSVIGTTYGAGDGSTTFGLPDSRGTMFAALDGQGVNGLAGRMGTTGGCTNSNTLGTLCGSQSHAQTTPELAAHTHNYLHAFNAGGTSGGGGLAPYYVESSTASSSTGSGTAMPILNPVLMGRRAIKY